MWQIYKEKNQEAGKYFFTSVERTPCGLQKFSEQFISLSETKLLDQIRWLLQSYRWKLEARIFFLTIFISALQTSSGEYLKGFRFLAFLCCPSHFYDSGKASPLCAGVWQEAVLNFEGFSISTAVAPPQIWSWPCSMSLKVGCMARPLHLH